LSKKSLEYKQFLNVRQAGKHMDIILASTSRYRRSLLERLRIEFRCASSDVDEQRLPGEAPDTMAGRLALAKARAIATLYPHALVLGSDQVASIDGKTLGKPGSFEIAAAQLLHSSGREVHFYTAVALVCTEWTIERLHVEPYSVRFRRLTEEQITQYLRAEQPYDCAGSFKVEGLGIALFEHVQGNDPTSLEGLPLIKVTELLAEVGVDVLGGPATGT
jgi:septum formation protein